MNNKYINAVFSIFLFTILFSLPLPESKAAPADCVQTATDGQISCQNANDYWVGVIAISPALTFVEYKNSAISYICNSLDPSIFACGEKTTNGPIDGRACDSFQDCNSISVLDSDNKGGTGVYYRYRKDIPNDPYIVFKIGIDHRFSCPSGYTQVIPDYDYGFRYCKPPYMVETKDSACPVAACPGGGVSKSTSASAGGALSGKSSSGDPIDIASGNKYVVENDYVYKAYWPLGFSRVYNAKTGLWSNNWIYTFTYSDFAPIGKVVSIVMPNGTTWSYKYNASTSAWIPNNLSDVNKLTQNVTTGEFTYALDNNVKVLFTPRNGASLSNSNFWQASKLTMVGGGEYTFDYDTNTGLLKKVANPNGVELLINQTLTQSGCNNNPVVTSITGPGAKTTTYEYTGSCQLTKVTYPDAKFKTYQYNWGGALEIVKDELGNWTGNTFYTSSYYRPSQSVTADGLGTSGNIDKVTFDYTSETSTVVRDTFNNAVTVTLTKQNNQTKPIAYSSLCTWCEGIQGSSISYNANGFMTSVTDFNGNVTNFEYDTSRNLLTRIKQSANNATLTRQTDITYDTTYKLPLTITEHSSIMVGGSYNNRVTTNTYDATTGRLTQKSIAAPISQVNTSTATRSWNFVYGALGQLTEIHNPRYVASSGAINDKIVNTYNTNGQVATVTNGLGQTITFSSFDSYGQPENITYADGSTLALSYNSRGKVIGMTKNGLFTTIMIRNDAQYITKVTSPSGAYREMTYDLTNRLTEIKEYNESSTYLGKTVFTLDNMSSVTKVQVLDALGSEIRLSNKQYNNKNQLFKDLTALNYETAYTYDANGNISNIKDANNKNIVFTYDSLNRVATQTNPDLGVVTYNYNPDDSIASVIAPTSQTTSYKYNGFGEIIEVNSPDTGITSITRDIGGNVLASIDARPIAVSYTYDAINRPLTVVYPSSSENVTMTYDTCTNGIGKVCSITDIAGTISYTYDSFGRITSKTNNDGVVSKTIGYGYDSADRLNKIVYPSGMEVNYTYSNNKPVSITYKVGSTTNNILTNGVYEAFNNSIKSFSYANGATYTKTFNKDGMVSAIATSVSGLNVNQGYGFDSRLNLNSITGANATSVTYDDNSRIKSFNGVSYNYTTNGNRTSVVNGGTTTYNNGTGNNKLLSLSGTITDTFGYDNVGNQTSSTGKTFAYNNANALSGYSDATNNYSYVVNSLGERVKKVDNNNASNNIVFSYHAGQLLAEYDSANIATEYIYLNGVPVAMVKNNVLYYVYTDQLGTPRTVTTNTNTVVWKWDNSEVFGNNTPSVSTIPFNLRFAGQYFDNESKLYYNYFRTYNPQTGKYISSDPIGLDGGFNTYAYVGGNSLSYIDPLGLSAKDIEMIRNIFNNSIKEMVNKNIRLPGDGSDLFNFNNFIAKACNPNIGNKGLAPYLYMCDASERTIEYCDGQSSYLSKKLNDTNLVYDDNWKFVSQNNKGHWWIVGMSSNKNDPIIYLDAWANEMSIGKICKNCKNGSSIGERPMSKEEIKILLEGNN